MRTLTAAAPSLLAVLAALLLSFLALAAIGDGLGHAANAFLAMSWGAFGDWPRFVETGSGAAVLRPLGEAGTKAALLTLTGLSVAVAFRVGLFNIGAQGQMVVGALAAAVLGAEVELPGVLHVPACLVASAACGAAWAALPAVLKLKRGVHEVISTIMLNWVAINLVDNWLVTGPLRAAAVGDLSIAGTAEIAQSARLPLLLGNASRLNGGLVLAVLLALGVWLFSARFVRGFEWRVAGAAPETARSSGIALDRVVLEAMLTAGALAGLAGAVLVLGTELKYPATLGAPYGFDGIAMALLGQGHALGVLASAAFFGALKAGGTRMQLLGVHKSFPELIQGLALLLVAARLVWERLLARRGAP